LAVSFVSARDTRLIGDLEKLLGKKIELEALELEADRRPAGQFNDGQRVWQQEERPSREQRSERDRPLAARAPARPPRASVDPLFDRPYEPAPASDELPAWESAQRPAARSASPNIRTRKKVPALFKRIELPAENA
jgi:hypothetical protein